MTEIGAPRAKRVEHRREHHGDVFIDHYEWLRDKSDPEVIAYLEAENAHTRGGHRRAGPVAAGHLRRDQGPHQGDRPVGADPPGQLVVLRPQFRGKQYGVHCRCPISDPDDWTPPELDENTAVPGEQILLDENIEAAGHEYFSLGAISVSIDGNILAYSVDVKGDERYTLRFKDLRTGELYEDTIAGIGAGVTWARTTSRCTTSPSTRLAAGHRVAAPIGSARPDQRVYHEADERYWLGVGRTRSDKYVIIAAGSAITSEVRYADAADPHAEFTVVWPRRDGIEYSVEHAIVGGEDRFLILHNDGAVNFTMVEAPVSDPTATRTLIEHRDDVRLDGVDAFDTHLWSATGVPRCPGSSCGPSVPTAATAHRRRSSSSPS